MFTWLRNLFAHPEPSGPPRLIQAFENTQPTISSSSINADGEGWLIECSDTQTIRLFEIDPGDIENGMVTYRAQLKSDDVPGRGYLEMWCQFAGQGEFFSKGLHNAIEGNNDWACYEIPFYLKKKQNPNLIKLNLTIEGSGKLWIKDIELSFTPFK